jgi:hypothetical protein
MKHPRPCAGVLFALKYRRGGLSRWKVSVLFLSQATRARTDDPLHPEERRRVEFGNATLAPNAVGEHQQHDKDQNETKKPQRPGEAGGILRPPARQRGGIASHPPPPRLCPKTADCEA